MGRILEVNQSLISAAIANQSGTTSYAMRSLTVSFPGGAMKGLMKWFEETRKGRGVYVLIGTRDLAPGSPGRVVALAGTLQDGKLIHMRRLQSR
jgi:hypothetical protein